MTTPHDRRFPLRALRWPVAAAFLVVLAGIAGVELGRRADFVGALVLSLSAALVAALGALSLVRGLRSAQSLALRDPLTLLPNRLLLNDRIEQALHRSRRSGACFALFAIDLDGFKEVNDVRGHEAGNQVLRSIAQRLESVVRSSDTVARVGGDEFVVLSLDTGLEDEAAALVGRIRHALRRPYRVDGAVVEIDASIGWALFPDDGATPAELLARADGQMYATKRDTGEDEATGRRMSLDAGVVREFEMVLERNELAVHYQPVLDLPSGAVSSVEALVRRLHPERGITPPAEFIPHVERTPLIRALTLHVAAEALKQARRWRDRGHPLRVSVNIPYRVIDDSELIDGIAGLLATMELEPDVLTVDVVPSGPGAGSELDLATLDKLVRAGVRLALDDFGRASSLAALRTLPLNEVKIDSVFVHRLGRSEADAAIVRALVELGHALGLGVIAEGVETRQAWDALASLGCDRAQGFYVQQPLPAERLTEWLEHRWPAVA